MYKFEPTCICFHKVSFDIYCTLHTIAMQLYECCDFDKIFDANYHSEIDGKKVSYTTNRPLKVSGWLCKHKYGWTFEILSKLFRTTFNKNDYPISRVRVHIQWTRPEIAQFIYNAMIKDRSDIELETPDTIGIDCKTLDEVENLWLIFLKYENQWATNIETGRNIERYNNRGSLERSTHSLITSICVMMIFIGLISQCCS